MKLKSALLALALTSSIAMAAPVPNAEIAKVNNFITTLLGDLSGAVQVAFLSAERSTDGKTVTAAKVKVASQDLAKMELDAKVVGDDLLVNAQLEVDASKQELSDETIAESQKKLEDYIAHVNKGADYVAALKMSTTSVGKVLAITVSKKAGAQTPAIKNLNFEMTYPVDLKKGKIKATLKSSFDRKNDEVKLAQESADRIFATVSTGGTPDQKDFQILLDMFLDLMSEVQI